MSAPQEVQTHDVIVIGAGFAGIYLVHRLRDELGLAVQGFERGGDVGGTWYWNRYPGARCDFESDFYSYSFDADIQRDWEWTERYASQPEILRYARFVADRLDVRRSIAFDTAVTRAEFDERDSMWSVETAQGDTHRARFLVGATGGLSVPLKPNIAGLESFAGPVLHTAEWPHEPIDLSSKRVAVIGTGSSGAQVIPQLALQAEHVTVFQRTATFTFPAVNRPLTASERRQTRRNYAALRQAGKESQQGVPIELPIGAFADVEPGQLRAELERRWRGGGWGVAGALTDGLTSREANEAIAEFVREKVRLTVDDPDTARRLEPRDYPVGTKRIVLDTDYLETFNRRNVSLVSLRETPIERVTPDGIWVGGALHSADVIVLATGFDAATGALSAFDVIGVDGRVLREEWQVTPRAFLGLAVHGFPNLFLVTGPGCAAAFANVLASIEHHVRWISGYIDYCGRKGIRRVEASAEAEAEWGAHVAELADETLFPEADSWYMGANVPGKPRTFIAYLGGTPMYERTCDEIAAAGYPGFNHSFAAGVG